MEVRFSNAVSVVTVTSRLLSNNDIILRSERGGGPIRSKKCVPDLYSWKVKKLCAHFFITTANKELVSTTYNKQTENTGMVRTLKVNSWTLCLVKSKFLTWKSCDGQRIGCRVERRGARTAAVAGQSPDAA